MSSVRCILPTQGGRADDGVREADGDRHIVSNNNRWSRITLSFDELEQDSWCELSFRIEWDAQEESRTVHDFAMIGVDFLTEDGSSIDFVDVPGLIRSQFDPHGWPIGGPDYCDPASSPSRSSRISCAFFVPSPARRLSISIRSWRNSHPFAVCNPRLVQAVRSLASAEPSEESADTSQAPEGSEGIGVRRTWRSLGTEPTWFQYAMFPGRRLLLRGQIINQSLGGDGAVARIVYRNDKGEALPPPYPDLLASPATGAFIDIPVHRQARRFTLDLAPPPEAASVEVGFQTWNSQSAMELVTPLEVSLEDDLLLETISGDDLPDALTFLGGLIARLGFPHAWNASEAVPAMLKRFVNLKVLASPFTFHDKLKSLQWNARAIFLEGNLTLGDFPSWSLPEAPHWIEDPFQSPAWRLEFQSLSWLCNLAQTGEPDSVARAIDLALSWSQANPWGHPKDPISAHPLSLSARAEALLLLLSLGLRAQRPVAPQKILALFAEVVRHGFALAQIVGQNVFVHSIAHIHAACALLALACALPQFPLAPYWTSLALNHVRDGFEQLLDRNGVFRGKSLHFQLEVISLGLVLVRLLKNLPETREFRDDLTSRLRKGLRVVVAVTNPSGALPSFGDAPHGYHHAAWLRRLLSGFGTSLLSDPELAAELSYPTGRKVFLSEAAGLIAARHYERNANWSYFCAALGGQASEHGHFDCTSFVYSTGGAGWIVDPRGSDLHETGPARQYLISSRAHNVALPDGREQNAGRGWIEAHQPLDGASIFQIRTNVHGPEYDHRRIILCLDSLHAVAVFDHFATQPRPVSFEGLLHFDTDIVVALASTQLSVAYRKDRKMRIVPHAIRGQFAGMSLENGRSDRPGTLQGFVARSSGGLQSANVLSYRFLGQGAVCGGVLLAADQRAAGMLSKLLTSAPVKNLFDRLVTSAS
jgi:hypothetical protein